jgi:hypothetical protein
MNDEMMNTKGTIIRDKEASLRWRRMKKMELN